MVKFAYRLQGTAYINLLLHLRWLVLLVAIPISLVIEVMEGNSHDLQFLDEVIIDGLVLPLSTWIVLTFVANKIGQQLEREQILEQQQLFMQRLTEHRDYHELIDFLVRFPTTLMSVEQVSLFVDDHPRGQLNLAAEWNLPSAATQPNPRNLGMIPVCRTCLSAKSSPAHETGTCNNPPQQQSELSPREYRILLVHDNVQVGIFRLRCLPAKTTADRIKQIMVFAPEIARALAQAIEDTQQAERAYREAQVYERRRITQEIHDSLAQQVFYLHLGLDQLANDLTPIMSETIQRRVVSMRNVAADVYEQIRNNLSILRAWEQVNLTEAITDLARVTAHNEDFTIDIDVQGETSWLSPHTCEQVYGVVRKALQNIVRHAMARHVTLSLIWTTDQLGIVLLDDGVGFEPDYLPAAGHYGLTLMRETIDALHGVMLLESHPGNGTRLHVAIPLQPSDTIPGRDHPILQELPVRINILR